MTLWSPDTCGCQIEMSDDPATLGQPIAYVVVCPAHAAKAKHTDVLEENKYKNKVLVAVEAAAPGVEVTWKMNADRTVSVTPVGTIPSQTSTKIADAIASVPKPPTAT